MNGRLKFAMLGAAALAAACALGTNASAADDGLAKAENFRLANYDGGAYELKRYREMDAIVLYFTEGQV